MKGFVINLKKRSDRLEKFKKEVQNYLLSLDIEVIDALDGSTIDLKNKFFLKNVNEWNFKYLDERTLRGVIGCCLSHLKCYKKIINSNEKYCVIFEDDCSLKKSFSINLNELIIPKKFGIIFLNDWIVKSKNIDDQSLSEYNIIFESKTTEAYIISKEFAKIMYDENVNNIGAIDAHMKEVMLKYPQYIFYELKNSLFTQYDRRDSNIRM